MKGFQLLASCRFISPTFCLSKLFERIIPSSLLLFLESNSFLFYRQAGFRPGCSIWIKFFIFLSPFRTDLTNPSWALGQFLLPEISLKLSTLSDIPLAFTNLFRLAFLLLCSMKSIFPFLHARLHGQSKSKSCSF